MSWRWRDRHCVGPGRCREAWGERSAGGGSGRDPLRAGKAFRVLLEALGAEELGADGAFRGSEGRRSAGHPTVEEGRFSAGRFSSGTSP